jgi:ribosomal-protein-alanine N-acetyltransferase
MTDIIITTDRLLLKGVTPQIIHEQFLTKSEEETRAFFGTDEKGYERLKQMHEKGMETDRLSVFFFLLIDKETSKPIGECGFHTWNRTHQRAEVYYALGDDVHKGKGLMTEALVEAIRFAFEQMNLHRIQALVANANTPSIRLLKRYGFSFEGTMREDYVVDGKSEDSDCYSLLKHEWLERQQPATINLSSAAE